jgi:DNA-binding response OmpR family regulator
MRTITSKSAPIRRILYVEEDEDSRRMLAFTLEAAGYAVSAVATIADGLFLSKRERFDLCILESGYSDGCGLDLCRQLRAHNPATPIIFYSGYVYPSDIAAGMAAGAHEYLTKPMGIYMMNQTVAGLLTSPTEARVSAH